VGKSGGAAFPNPHLSTRQARWPSLPRPDWFNLMSLPILNIYKMLRTQDDEKPNAIAFLNVF
ncbi:hypothetical protein, partial [Aquiflexum sp.]|uniref:hypothetical protein n=1 Tax=Aquiflexum sp. TaxID=1872584 RepID=UPI003593D933